MGELLWSDVQGWFDAEDAPLHDGCVVGVVPGAWQAVAAFVEAKGWRVERADEGMLFVLPAEEFFVNFFEVDEEVVFDIHVGELQRQERVDLLAAFLRELGQGFGLPVALTVEGGDPRKVPYLHYDPVGDEFVLDR